MKRYVIKTCLFIVCGLFGIALFNAVVDPLDIYRLVRLPGFNDIKPRLDTFSRLAKPMWLSARPYERLALGSSRTEIGIPISSEKWGEFSGPGMNGAVSGARLTEVAAIFEHASLVAPIKTVVIGADFFMFNGHSLGQYASPQALAQDNTPLDLLLNKAASTLFSYKITAASLYTITHQRPKYDKYRRSGQMNSAREAAKSRKNGYPSRFQRFADSFMERIWSPCKSNAYTYKGGKFDSMAIFAEILARAAAEGIDIKIFIPPAHARMLEALSAAGHWPQFEEWKRDMVEVIAGVREKTPGAAITLWDFSGYYDLTMEPFPAPGELMTWYIDSTHFSEAFGRLIIARMYGSTQQDVGHRLTGESVPRVIEMIRTQQQEYRRRHPEVLQEMQKRFQKINRRKKKTGKSC
ncbi:MAG: hypothetical protein C0613_09385 [Desulfobulbaceae bacterium]|nr:MAG: hypothetical protein C0613_09385 [Desulfobulbaceae bacterium]